MYRSLLIFILPVFFFSRCTSLWEKEMKTPLSFTDSGFERKEERGVTFREEDARFFSGKMLSEREVSKLEADFLRGTSRTYMPYILFGAGKYEIGSSSFSIHDSGIYRDSTFQLCGSPFLSEGDRSACSNLFTDTLSAQKEGISSRGIDAFPSYCFSLYGSVYKNKGGNGTGYEGFLLGGFHIPENSVTSRLPLITGIPYIENGVQKYAFSPTQHIKTQEGDFFTYMKEESWDILLPKSLYGSVGSQRYHVQDCTIPEVGLDHISILLFPPYEMKQIFQKTLSLFHDFRTFTSRLELSFPYTQGQKILTRSIVYFGSGKALELSPLLIYTSQRSDMVEEYRDPQFTGKLYCMYETCTPKRNADGSVHLPLECVQEPEIECHLNLSSPSLTHVLSLELFYETRKKEK